jgi:hypothetical protein
MSQVNSIQRETVSPENLGDLYKIIMGPILNLTIRKYLWLAQKNGESCFVFLSREGELLHRTFNYFQKLGYLQNIKSKYLYVSRRALIQSSLADEALTAKFVLQQSFEGSTLNLWTGRFGIPSQVAMRYLSQAEASVMIRPGDNLAVIEQFENAKLAYGKSVEGQEQARNSKNYLASILEEAHSDVLICDIGYSGTMQSLIETKMNQKYTGVYLAVARKNFCLGRMHGILSDSLVASILSDTKTFEVLFNLGSPTVAAYCQGVNGVVLPILDDATIRESSFLGMIESGIQEAAKLMIYDESEVEALLQYVYPTRLNNLLMSQSGFKDYDNFEDLWSGEYMLKK